jgi:hypothetical protein
VSLLLEVERVGSKPQPRVYEEEAGTKVASIDEAGELGPGPMDHRLARGQGPGTAFPGRSLPAVTVSRRQLHVQYKQHEAH